MKVILRLLIFFTFLSIGNPVISQKNKYLDSLPDTIMVEKGSRVTYGNSSFIPDNDTIIIVPDSIYFKVKMNSKMRSDHFYEKMEEKSEKSKFNEAIYNITFVNQNRSRTDTVMILKGQDPFVEYEGKVIRNIRIKRLKVFGPSLSDTSAVASGGFGKLLNAIHITSREWTIKNNVRIKEGDNVNALIMAENERVLRTLPYIEDAVILLTLTQTESDSVDVLVITKDVWSISVAPIIRSATNASFRLYDANFLGLGHNMSHEIGVNTKDSPVAKYSKFAYEFQNIAGSFITGLFEYINDPTEDRYYSAAYRPFMPPLFTVAGGASFKRVDREVNYVTNDTTIEPNKLKFDSYSFWMGKTFPLNIDVKEDENKTYLSFSGSFFNYTAIQHQEFYDDYKYNYENRMHILGNVSLSRNNYYLTSLIYSFGITEDIAYGYNIGYTFGEKIGEFKNEFFSAIKLSYGNFTPKGRYYYGSLNYGGYIHNKSISQGVLWVKGSYVSRLSKLFGSQLRNFLNFEYTIGISRYSYEKIYLDGDHGFRGVGPNEELTGISRLSVTIESVLFTPMYFLGFRFAFFGYVDNGFIGYRNNPIATNNYFMGLGLGIRIRNENLIFRTFQINLAFYPIAPNNVNPVTFSIRSEDRIKPFNFNPSSPGLVVYR